jgi:predicted HicB family RNase H-like nuclease
VKKLEVVEKYTYRVIWSDEDQEHVGLCAEFPSLSWLDASQAGALRGIVDAVRQAVRDMQKAGEPIPEPLATRRYSGQFKVRIPPQVHRRLSMEAAESKVSLNRLISAKLAQG